MTAVPPFDPSSTGAGPAAPPAIPNAPQDPAVAAARQAESVAITNAQQDRMGLANMGDQQAKSAQGMLDQDAALKPPQDMLPQLTSQAPFFIAMTALGGALTKQSGMAMLSAMNGIVQGTMKGNTDAYNQAWKRYEDEHQKIMDRLHEQQQIYKQMRDAYSSRIDADDLAVQAALRMTGDSVQNAKWNYEQTLKVWDYTQQMDLKNRELQERKREHSDTIKLAGDRIKLMNSFTKVAQGYSRTVTADQDMKRLKEILPSLIGRYKTVNHTTIVPQNLGKILSAMSQDPLVGEFDRLAKSLKAQLVGLEMPQGSRGNMFIQKIIADTAPDFWSMNPSQLQTLLNADSVLLAQAKDQQHQEMEAYQSELSNVGGPNMMVNEATYQSPNAPPVDTANAHIATEDDVQATMSAHPEMSRTDVLDALRKKGFTVDSNTTGAINRRGVAPKADGLVEQGTINNLFDRPILRNKDRSYSTTLSFSFEENGLEVLIPQVVDGKKLSRQEAIRHYRQTGEHLGKFDTPEHADEYATSLHNEQDRVQGPDAER